TKRQAERANLRGGSFVEQLAGRLLDRVVDAAAIPGMQHRRDKHSVSVADAGERHPQAPRKGQLGAVVGVLAPSDITEPASGAMKSLGVLGQVREQCCRPLLQPVAIEAEAAVASGYRRTSCDQRMRPSLPNRNQPVSVAFAQPRCRENHVLWSCCRY